MRYVTPRQLPPESKARARARPRFGRQLPRRDVSHRRSPRGGRAAPAVAARNGAWRLRTALGEGRLGRGNAAGGSLFSPPPATPITRATCGRKRGQEPCGRAPPAPDTPPTT